jgi:branched-chain amino acid transport system ATP-binding protein
MEVLRASDLLKKFEGVVAVNGVSFTVDEGEILGIIGPNGSGKTTLLNLITGLIEPDRGEIFIRGERADFRSHEIASKGVGRTFQITKLFKSLTVLENMLVPVTRGEREEKLERAKEWLKFFELYHLKDELAESLSGGQQKLLELARVMMLDPSILLMDEPFAGVHHKVVRKIVELINKLREERRTFLIVSHDMHTIFNLCDRMIVMNEGKKIAEGSPDDIRKDREIIRIYLGV